MMDNTSISLFLWEFDSDMWICHAINLVAILNILTVLSREDIVKVCYKHYLRMMG